MHPGAIGNYKTFRETNSFQGIDFAKLSYFKVAEPEVTNIASNQPTYVFQAQFLAEAKKALSQELEKDDDYVGWVSSIPEDKWEIFQSKNGVTSKQHGKNTVFQIEMLEGAPPLEVQQTDPSIELFKMVVVYG